MTRPARRPRAVLLDLDETLLDNGGLPRAAGRTCAAVAGRFPALEADGLRAANAAVWRDYWPQVERLCHLGRLGGLDVSREAWRRTLRARGCADEDVVRYAFACHRRFAADERRLFADATGLLVHLRRESLPVALVTNGPADVQREHLSALALDDALDAVVISGEIGVAKPDPAPFRLALERLRVEAVDAWHIGDSLTSDVPGARAAGIRAVWLNRDARSVGPHARPDLEVRSLSEVVALLSQPRR